MNRLPVISIIMPTFNRGHLIAETIESVRSQTFTNWELLIMDDGSDDDTEKIVSGFADNRIHFYKCGRSGHVSRIKNLAIRKAAADLIAFIDSDDLWAPAKLEKQLAALNEYPEAGYCLTGGYNFINKNEPGDFLYQRREGIRTGNFLVPMLRSEVARHIPVLLFRKNCVTRSGFFDETKLFSDPDFILSLASGFEGVLLYEPLYYRRLHTSNDSSANWEPGYNGWATVIRSFLARKKITKPVAKEALFKLYINYGEKCLVKEQRWKALKNFMIAWMNRPLSIVPAKKVSKAILHFFRR